MEGFEEAMDIIKEYEDIIKQTKEHNILCNISNVMFLENLSQIENLVLLNNLI